MFAYCFSLRTIFIPNVLIIPENAFTGLVNLQPFTLAKNVTISAKAFSGCSNIVIDLQNEILSIGDSAFEMTAVDQVVLPACTRLGYHAFRACFNLTSISAPTVTTITAYFAEGCCNLTSLSFPSLLNIPGNCMPDLALLTNVTLAPGAVIGKEAFKSCISLEFTSLDYSEIGDRAFSDCIGLKEIALSRDAVLGNNVFVQCSSLASFSAPEVTSLATAPFFNCISLVSISFPKVKTVPDNGFMNLGTLEHIVLAPLAIIGPSAFKGCSNMTTVDADYSEIKSNSFSLCLNLVSVNLPNCTSVASNAFKGCSSLVNASAPLCTFIGESIFSSCIGLAFISFPTLLAVPDDGFSGLSSLETADLRQVISIGDHGMRSCPNMRTIPPKVVNVGKYAFANWRRLESINSESMQYIDEGAFSNCPNLVRMSLQNATHVGANAFSDCMLLTEIETFVLTDFAGFQGSTVSVLIDHYPTANKYGPMASTLTKLILTEVTYLQSISNLYNLTTLILHQCLTLGPSALAGLAKLSVIDMNQCHVLDEDALMGCVRLERISIPNVAQIASTAFFGCSSLSFIELPTKLCTTPFTGCPIKEMNLIGTDPIPSDGLIAISTIEIVHAPATLAVGRHAFYRLPKLAVLEIPCALSVGDGAFEDCPNLTTIVLTALETASDRSFALLTKITNLSLPNLTTFTATTFAGSHFHEIRMDVIENIPPSAFDRMATLVDIFIPEVKEIGQYALRGTQIVSFASENLVVVENGIFMNSAIHSVSFPNAKEVRDAAFAGSQLTDILMPSLQSIGTRAFMSTPFTEADFSNVHILSPYAFSSTNITSISFPRVQSIPSHVFADTPCLTELTFDILAIAAPDAFANLTTLITFNAPLLASLSDSIFSGCASLTTLNSGQIISVGAEAIRDTAINTLDLSSVTHLSAGAFRHSGLVTAQINHLDTPVADLFSMSKKLTKVSLPLLKETGAGCFYGCLNLVEVTLPSLTLISDRAFTGAVSFDPSPILPHVDSIGVESLLGTALPNLDLPIAAVGSGAFCSCRQLVTAKVAILSPFMFEGCTSLHSIDANTALVSEGAFINCVSLVHVSFPNARIVETEAFAACLALVTVDLPAVTSIEGADIFKYCQALENVSLPSLSSISPDVLIFGGCKCLKFLTLGSAVPKTFHRATFADSPDVQLIAPDLEAYDNDCAVDGDHPKDGYWCRVRLGIYIPRETDRTGIIIGCSIGGAVLIAGVITAVYFYKKYTVKTTLPPATQPLLSPINSDDTRATRAIH